MSDIHRRAHGRFAPSRATPASYDPSIPRYLRLPELRQMVPLSPATIWRKTRAGTFPPAIKISERVTAWNREAVEAWLAQKEAA